MTKSKVKYRKHSLKQTTYRNRLAIAGLSTLAAGAVALSSSTLTQADELQATSSQVAVEAVQSVARPQTIKEVAPAEQASSQVNQVSQPVAQVTDQQVESTVSAQDMDTEATAIVTTPNQTATEAVPAQAVVATENNQGPSPATVGNIATIATDSTYTKPVNGPVSAGFEGYPGHGGIDFAVPEGTPVHAARDGVVTIAQANHPWMGWQGGNAVLIQHEDGMHTGYAHLSQINVSVGQKVKQGQVIGLSGSTGLVTGPHLHFEFLPANPDFSNGHSGRIDGTSYISQAPFKAEPTPDRYDPAKLAKEVGQTMTDGDYHIVSSEDSKLSLSFKDNKNESNIQLEPYEENTGIFNVKYLGNGYYKISEKTSNRSLDVDHDLKENGTNIHLYDSNGAKNQQWIIKESQTNGAYEIVSASSGMNIDINGGQFKSGTNIQLYTPNHSAAQLFKFIAVDKDTKATIADGDYQIASLLDDNLVLDVAHNSVDNNANVQTYTKKTSNRDNQIFSVKYLNNGYYQITAKQSGKNLDVHGDGNTNGTNIAIYDKNPSDAQQWIIKPSAHKGAYEIISKRKNKALDVTGGSTKPETNVELFIRNGSKAQAWRFLPVKNVEIKK